MTLDIVDNERLGILVYVYPASGGSTTCNISFNSSQF